MGKRVRIWVDDERPAPDGYRRARSVNEAVEQIERAESAGDEVELLDLDHDLGSFACDGGDAIKLLDYLVERGTLYPVRIHTQNPVGRQNMERTLRRFWT